MKNVNVLMAGMSSPLLVELLDQETQLSKLWEQSDRDEFLAQNGEKFEVLATDGHHGATPKLIDQLPHLKLILCHGVGYDGIDCDYARQKGIPVTNTPDVLNDAVADLALGMMLAFSRQIPEMDRYVREGSWQPGKPYPLTRQLSNSSVGIVGLGRIGKEIALRCRSFKMDVSYFGRRWQHDQPYRYYDNLHEMAKDVTWLVLAMPATDETKHIVDRTVLRNLGPEGVLVNIARGSLVEEQALIELLEQRQLGGAALDVFENEPSVPQALKDSPHVLLTPHAGSGTLQTRTDMANLVLDNLKAFVAGQPLLTPVN